MIPNEQIAVYDVHDSVAFEKIYRSQFLEEGITDIRYRIMMRNSNCYYYMKQKSPSYKREWNIVKVSRPFPSLKEAKMDLGYNFIGYDVCANKSEKRQLNRHNFRKDYKIIVKEKALKLGKKVGLFVFWVGYALYALFIINFTTGGLESLGIDQDNFLFFLGYPIIFILLAFPIVCLFVGNKILERKKDGRL